MSVLYFGDVGEYLAIIACQQDKNAVLVDHSNYRHILDSRSLPPVCYTSLGDLPKGMEEVYSILDLADEIIYVPPAEWSDRLLLNPADPDKSMQGLSDIIMFDFSETKGNVTGLDLSGYRFEELDRLKDQRQTETQQLWIVGCSFSHGTGVEPTQRYGHLLSEKINLPVSFLTSSGSSPEWAADQILRSDIRDGDLVVWGLTYEGRMPWWLSDIDQMVHVTLGGLRLGLYKDKTNFDVPESVLLHVVSSDSRIQKSVTSVKQVANYCSKVGAKLLIIGLLSSDAVTFLLNKLPEFEPVRRLKHLSQYLDLGTDGSHPGPLQHQFYAEFCFEQMQRRGYI